MSVFRRHPAASIASLTAVICLVVAGALVWAHPWSASASDGTRFTIGDDETKLYADICRTESCSVSGDAKSQDAASQVDAVRSRIRDDKALLLIAKERGYGDATTYEAFLSAMRNMNTEKTAQAASGQTVYGVTSGQSVEQVSGKLSAALDGITAGDLSKADAAIKQAVPAVAAGTTMIVRKRATR